MTGEEAKAAVDQAAEEVFDIIPSHFDQKEANQVASVMADLVLRLCPLVQKYPEVRHTLESCASSNKSGGGQ